MINIQRNFFIETILFEIKIFNKRNNKVLPYKDYIETSIKDELILIFFDIDRVENLKELHDNLKLFRNKKNKIIFVPTSKNATKLSIFIHKIEKNKLKNLILINLNKLNIEKITDPKREKIYKSYLSLETQLVLSKIIENIINLLLNKDIRLLSLDLDNTCWCGVVGEDGINKIYLDNYQKKSLSFINQLIKKTGLLISIHSKNEKKLAIKAMKKKLSKYSSLANKSFKYISWDSKLKSIKNISKLVNFSKKNIIYLDDNISEIKQVNKFLIKENCLWIKNSYIFYLYSKSIFFSNFAKVKNIKRFNDIKSNIKRSEITGSEGALNYVKTSNVKLTFSLKKIDLNRFVEMSNKTNQFNSNYLRLKNDNIRSLKKNIRFKIITFSVSDKYSDSGIIAAILLERNKKYDQVIEFLISCRALGRGLEYVFINQIIKKFSIKDLRISYIKTESNEPFIRFVEKIKIKKDKKNFFININSINKIANKYEEYIKIKIN